MYEVTIDYNEEAKEWQLNIYGNGVCKEFFSKDAGKIRALFHKHTRKLKKIDLWATCPKAERLVR